jgi:hypothetical protein
MYVSMSLGMPRFYFDTGLPVSFKVKDQVLSPLGYPLTFAIATTDESSLPTIKPLSSSFDASTGSLTWTPPVKGSYALSVLINDGYNRIPLDIIFEVKDGCTEASPCAALQSHPRFSPVTATTLSYYRYDCI